MDALRPFIEALRVLAQTNDLNRVVLIENAINEFSGMTLRDYVRARLRRLA